MFLMLSYFYQSDIILCSIKLNINNLKANYIK